MSTTIKKNTALVLTSLDPTYKNLPASHRFVELIKACGIEAKIAGAIEDINQAKMYDCIMLDSALLRVSDSLWQQVLLLTNDTTTVLFNANEQEVCESSALLSGVKGIFYQDDRPDLILKGLELLMNNESWFKRSTMDKAIADLLKLKPANQGSFALRDTEINLPQLTKREQMIVQLVSSGAQNKEIAEQLHISPNTVKTHIYSLFRKTSSRNRIELITWSQQFNPMQRSH